MSKAICIIGESYCGKDFFINRLKDFTSADVIHVGDEMRKLNVDGVCADPMILADVIERNLTRYGDVIIDNAFKNVEQAEKVIHLLHVFDYEVSVILVVNNRKDFNIKSRKRADDDKIPEKWDLWKQEFPNLFSWLLRNQGEFTFRKVFNTDEGVLI